MPLDGNALAPDQLATIKTWIDEGAHGDPGPVEAAIGTARALGAQIGRTEGAGCS